MTYYAAISTDIKKSSVNWNELPEWMYIAVQRTNNITEDIVLGFGTGIRAKLLPNAPEGDAYTYYFSHGDREELKKHVLTIGFTLQEAYKQAREKYITALKPDKIPVELKKKYNEDTVEYKSKLDEILSTEYYGAIYVRIGIAVSPSPPLQYSFNKLVSFRGGVIDDSERAEAKGAPIKDGVGYTEKGKPVEELTEYDGVEVDMANINTALLSWKYNAKNVTKARVKGTMCFVHYHFDIDEKVVEKSPHLYKYMQEEFKDLHDGANAILANVNAELVKVKRSSDSMYYIPDTAQQSQIWKVCRLLVATLPKGSAVGLCYGQQGLTQITYNKKGDRRNGKHDYFGPVVNLAARMEFSEWGYDTLTDRIDVNKHDNRLAMCWYGEDIPLDCQNNIDKPYLVESVPLSALNAGTATEFLKIMSCHVLMGNPLQVGDEVYYDDDDGKEQQGKVLSFSALYARIKLFRKGRYTTYVKSILLAELRRNKKPTSASITIKQNNNALKF